jgi:DNA replication protein DnaC
VEAGHRVRYFTAAELVDTIYRRLADNSVGRVIDAVLRTVLRADLVLVDEVGFAPLDDSGAQLLFRFVAAAYERRALGIGSHWPFDQWAGCCPSTPPPSACSTGCCTTAMSSSPKANRSACASPKQGGNRTSNN